MNKIKKIISGIGIIAFVMTWGVIGGMEQNYIDFDKGAFLCTILMATVGLCLYAYRAIEKELEYNRQRIKQMQKDYCNYILIK